MSRLSLFWRQLAGSRLRTNLLLGAGALLLVLGLAFWLWPSNKAFNITITDSTTAGTREHVLNYLKKNAAHQGVVLKKVPTVGSIEALNKVNAGEIDLALVQGTVRLPQHPTASAYQTCVSDRTSVRNAVLAMHETILPRRLSFLG